MNSRTSSAEADRVCEFIETFCTLGGSFYGQRFILEPFQRDVIADIYRAATDARNSSHHGRLRRSYLLGLPRKNAKTTLAAALALYHLFADSFDPAPVVISAAGDRQQAKLTFNEAKRMVQTNPALAKNAHVYRDHIINRRNGGLYKAVSADAALQQGLNPSFVVFDEVHVFKNSELIEALTLGSGMRRMPLFLFISTAGYDLESPLGQLYTYGRKVESGEVTDQSFGFTWHGPKDGETFDPTDPSVWARFNPLFRVMSEADFEASFRRTHISAFIRYRLNGWTATESSWLPHGAWSKLGVPDDELLPGEPVVLGFDGSKRLDSTALVACRLTDFKLFVLGTWEAAPGDNTWQAPVDEVEKAIREACKTYDVKEVACDPWRWEQSLYALTSEGLPIVEFPTNSKVRMTPAIQSFYEAVMNGTLTHDGNPALARHITNTVATEDASGWRLSKVTKSSKRHIDLTVAAVIAHHRARRYVEPEQPREAQLLVL